MTGKTNNLIVLGSNKTKVRKQDSQNRLIYSVEKDKHQYPLTHVYMTAHFPGLLQAFQLKSGVAKLVLRTQVSLLYEMMQLLDMMCVCGGGRVLLFAHFSFNCFIIKPFSSLHDLFLLYTHPYTIFRSVQQMTNTQH